MEKVVHTGERLTFAASLEEDGEVVTGFTMKLEVFKSGSTKPQYTFDTEYSTTTHKYSCVWDTTGVTGEFLVREAIYDSNGWPIKSAKIMTITVEP